MFIDFVNRLSKLDIIFLGLSAFLNNLPLFIFYAAACYVQQHKESPNER